MNAIQENIRRYIKEGGWSNRSELANMAHDHMHLSKLTGDLARYLEMYDHYEQGELTDAEMLEMESLIDALRIKLAPDLAIFAARFAEYFGQDLDKMVEARMDRNRRKKLGTR